MNFKKTNLFFGVFVKWNLKIEMNYFLFFKGSEKFVLLMQFFSFLLFLCPLWNERAGAGTIKNTYTHCHQKTFENNVKSVGL